MNLINSIIQAKHFIGGLFTINLINSIIHTNDRSYLSYDTRSTLKSHVWLFAIQTSVL